MANKHPLTSSPDHPQVQTDPCRSHHQEKLFQHLAQSSQAGLVRLDTEECEALAYALKDETKVKLALFGSRTQFGRRGGDIDLLVLGEVPAFETAQRIATRFFSRCEEKLDVIVIDPHSATAEQQAFLASIHTVPIA